MTPTLDRPHTTPLSTAAVNPRRAVRGDWTPVWFSLVEHEWTSLAIVPSHPNQSTRNVAAALAEVARAYDGEELEVIEAEHTAPVNVRKVAERLAEVTASGKRVLLALSSPVANYAAIPLARKTDAAILLVPLDVGRLADVRRSAELIGRARFIGSVTVASPEASAPEPVGLAKPPAVEG